MRILTLNYEFPPVGGGGGRISYELCRQLVCMGHEVDVVTMRYGDLPHYEEIAGVKIHRTAALRCQPDICRTHEMATYLLGAVGFTLKLARRCQHDIIHCHFTFPTGVLGYFVSRVTGIPCLITCHGSDVPRHNPDRFILAHKLLHPVWRYLACRAPMLTAPSESLKQTIRKACPQAQVMIVPNGIHLDSYVPSRKKKYILMCSRILKFKGFQYAIEAVKSLDIDWQLHIIGDGPYLPALKERAAGSKMPITFWGWLDRSDPRFEELHRESSIFLFPSEAENFPTVLLDAMAAGMAIITTTAGGCPEVVGSTGRLVQPRDVDGIRNCLQELIASGLLRRRLANLARRRVETLFSWPTVAQAYLDCYHTVIKNKGE